MGQNCQTTHQQIHTYSLPLEIKDKYKQSLILNKKHKDQPDPQFASPITKTPEINQKMKTIFYTLGSLNDMLNQKYDNGTELGPYLLQNKTIYVGEWKNGKLHGEGRYYLPDCSIFQGISKENQIEGPGRIIHPNGNYFQGEFKQGLANGEGVCVQQNKTYKGMFKDNLQHGDGVQYSQLYEFKGKFSQGSKVSGRLIMKQKQKFQYQGEFKKNKFHGQGRLVTEKYVYEGRFENGAKNGEGKLAQNSGEVYVGQFKDDRKHGKGRVLDENNKVIKEGRWQSDNYVS